MKIKYNIKKRDDYIKWKNGDVVYWKEGFDTADRNHCVEDKIERDIPYIIGRIHWSTAGVYRDQYLMSIKNILSDRDYSAASFTKIRE